MRMALKLQVFDSHGERERGRRQQADRQADRAVIADKKQQPPIEALTSKEKPKSETETETQKPKRNKTRMEPRRRRRVDVSAD